MELNVSVRSVSCFTLLFECVLQGNLVDRWLVQGVNCRLGSGSLTGLGAGLWLLSGARSKISVCPTKFGLPRQ